MTGYSTSLSKFELGTSWLSLVPIVVLVGHLKTLCSQSLDLCGHSLLKTFMMAQSLDASVSSLMCVLDVLSSLNLMQNYMSLSFLIWLYLNSSGWNSILTGCPLLPFSGITVVCTVLFACLLVLFLLDSQIWWHLSTNTFSLQSEFPLYYTLLFELFLLCLTWCTTIPKLCFEFSTNSRDQRNLREWNHRDRNLCERNHCDRNHCDRNLRDRRFAKKLSAKH